MPRLTKLSSTIVLIVAALLLELTTAVQYYSTRQGINRQVKETAQRELSATQQTAQIKQTVETTMGRLLPQIERLTYLHKTDSLRMLIRQTLVREPNIVGIDYCHVVGADGAREGIYIFKPDEEKEELTEQVIDFDYTKRSWYSEALSTDGYWSEPYMSRYKVLLMCTYSLPVCNPQGERVAVLGADLPMRELSILTSQLYEHQERSLLPIILLHITGLLLLAFIIQRAIHHVRKLQAINADKERIEGELNIARGIQQAMLPKIFPPFPDRQDVDIYAQLTPAREVGGDFYDFLIRDQELFFCIGDVSGKGVPAALVMAVARSTFRMLSSQESRPEQIVSAMNATMAQDNDYNMFITLFVGVLNLSTGHLRYCNAGHKAPLLIHPSASGNERNGNEHNSLTTAFLPIDNNLPVGAMPDWPYTVQETTIAPQTTLFLYTDGLTEAEAKTHQQLGRQRMTEAVISAQPKRLIEDMTNTVHQFIGGYEQSDDLTMLAISFEPTLTPNPSLTLPEGEGIVTPPYPSPKGRGL